MRIVFVCLLLALTGCHSDSPHGSPPASPSPAPAKSTNDVLKVIPIVPVTGKIVFVNARANYVIISLAPGLFPAAETRLFAYRNGLKRAELRVTGPQQDDKLVADIVSGTVEISDTVNDN